MLYDSISRYYLKFFIKKGQKEGLSIRRKYLKSLPFRNLRTRLGTAVILSYFGDDEAVSRLLQRLSHRSRAFFFNAKGLKGFLTVSVSTILERATAQDLLKEETKFQKVDVQSLIRALADI